MAKEVQMIKLTKEELAIIGESRYMKQYRIKTLIALMVSSGFVVIGMGVIWIIR